MHPQPVFDYPEKMGTANLKIKKMLNLKTSWEDVKEKIKESTPELTDADLIYQPGEEKKLLQHLAKKMNRSEDHIKDWIESVAVNEGKAS